MTDFRADYIVRSGLALPENVERSALVDTAPNVTIILKNAPPNAEGHAPHLVAEVIGPCDYIGEAS